MYRITHRRHVDLSPQLGAIAQATPGSPAAFARRDVANESPPLNLTIT